jgi:hypothetical protein
MLLRPEDRSDLEYLLESRSHHHLLIQLGALVEKCLFLKISDGKKLGAPLGGCSDNFWGGNIHKATGKEIFVNRTGHCTPDLEDCRYSWSACIEESCIKPGVKVCRNLF